MRLSGECGVHELRFTPDGLVVADSNQPDLLDIPLDQLFASEEFIKHCPDLRSLDEVAGELPAQVADLPDPDTDDDPLDWTHHDELYDELTDELADTPEPIAARPGYAERMDDRRPGKKLTQPVKPRERKELARRP